MARLLTIFNVAVTSTLFTVLVTIASNVEELTSREPLATPPLLTVISYHPPPVRTQTYPKLSKASRVFPLGNSASPIFKPASFMVVHSISVYCSSSSPPPAK